MNNKKLVVLIVGILCVAFSVFGIIKATNSPFRDIPLFDIVMDKDEIEEVDKELKEHAKSIESVTKDKIEKFEKNSGMDWDVIVNFFENPSVNDIIKLVDSIDEFRSNPDMIEMINSLKIFRAVIIAYGVIIAVISLLGVLLKTRACAVVSIILSLAFYVAFVGIVYWILFTILNIAYIILFTQANKAAATPNMQY